MKRPVLRVKWRGASRGVLAGVLAAVLLCPLPVFAITFLNDWTIFTDAQGGAPQPFVFNVDFPFAGGQGNYFFVDTGNFQGGEGVLGSSTMFATRTLRVNPAGETLFLYQTFGLTIQNAMVTEAMIATPLTGGTAVNPLFVLAQAQNEHRNVDGTQYSFTPVVAGDYQLTMAIQLQKSRFGEVGGWRTVSPFQFLVLGL
jgi:hypothetical protein